MILLLLALFCQVERSIGGTNVPIVVQPDGSANVAEQMPVNVSVSTKPTLPTTPSPIPSGAMWTAQHENGSVQEWLRTGGAPGNEGSYFDQKRTPISATSTTYSSSMDAAKSGKYSLKLTLKDAWPDQHVGIMACIWTTAPWDKIGYDGLNGHYFPNPTYSGTWINVPKIYNCTEPAGSSTAWGWWDIVQYMSPDADDQWNPTFFLNVKHNKTLNKMYLVLHDKVNQTSHDLGFIEAGKWFHFELFLDPKATATGKMTCWVNGVQMVSKTGIKTVWRADKEYLIFNVCNYTQHITGEDGDGNATVYFDDCIVSKERIWGKF